MDGIIIYAARWGMIKSAYAGIEAMRTKTRSRNLGARLFCFIRSLMAFNAWVVAWILLRSLISELSLSRRLGDDDDDDPLMAFKETI